MESHARCLLAVSTALQHGDLRTDDESYSVKAIVILSDESRIWGSEACGLHIDREPDQSVLSPSPRVFRERRGEERGASLRVSRSSPVDVGSRSRSRRQGLFPPDTSVARIPYLTVPSYM